MSKKVKHFEDCKHGTEFPFCPQCHGFKTLAEQMEDEAIPKRDIYSEIRFKIFANEERIKYSKNPQVVHDSKVRLKVLNELLENGE